MATDPTAESTSRRGRTWRRRGLLAVGFVALLLAGALAWLLLADVAPLAARLASARLGRGVTIGSARLHAGPVLGASITDIRIANAAWGRAPDFLRAERVEAAIDLKRLLSGEILVPRLSIDGMEVALEHGPNGQGNWKPDRPSAAPPHEPPARPWLPTILAFDLRDSRLLVHTTRNQDLTLATAATSLRTTSADSPVRMTASLVYDGAPIAMNVEMDSFDAYRIVDRRFAFRAVASADGGRLALDGTAELPLAFDGVTGALRADLDDIGTFAGVFGARIRLALAARIDGALTHQGRVWQVDRISGQLAGSDAAGMVELTEGTASDADNIRADLALARLDLAPLFERIGPAAPTAPPAVQIAVQEDPGTRVDARLAVADLAWGRRNVSDLRLHAALQPRRVSLDGVQMTIGGGRLTGSLTATTARVPSDPPLLALRADLAQADAAALLRLAGSRSRLLSGPVDGHAAFDAQAATAAELRGAVTGQLVLAMKGGRISRNLMALASTDLGLLLGDDGGSTNLSCLLAALDLREGFGVLSPVRLRSGEGALSGGGVLDLARRSMDLSFRTDRATTGFLALDVPVRITGPFAAPAIRPAFESDANAIAAQGARTAAALPEPMRSLAVESRCLH